jgi:hypothetical protein
MLDTSKYWEQDYLVVLEVLQSARVAALQADIDKLIALVSRLGTFSPAQSLDAG